VTTLERYSHSGSFTASGIVTAVVVAMGISALLSPVYAYALHFIPFVYINCFIVFGFGLAVGFATGYGFKLGKVRSLSLAGLVAFGMGVVADYFGWVSWLFATSHEFIVKPSDIRTALAALAQTGVWSIGRSTPTGTFLYLVWTAELLSICVLAAFAARSYLEDQVFCERCGDWLPDAQKVGPLEPLPPDAVANFKAERLQALEPVEADAPSAVHLELRNCPTCHLLPLVTAKMVTRATDSRGNTTSRETVLVENAHAPAALFQALSAGRGATRAARREPPA
jgi:hypothetical protein